MTTKSPTSTCGAYWGLCLPRRSCATWLASRPSTTSVASMTCQARSISPGLGEYVRTALVSSVVSGGLVGSPHRARETERSVAGTSRPARQPTTIPAGRPALTRRRADRSADLGQPPGRDVVDGAPDIGGQQVGALA